MKHNRRAANKAERGIAKNFTFLAASCMPAVRLRPRLLGDISVGAGAT
jgi:hypothetical protein